MDNYVKKKEMRRPPPPWVPAQACIVTVGALCAWMGMFNPYILGLKHPVSPVMTAMWSGWAVMLWVGTFQLIQFHKQKRD